MRVLVTGGNGFIATHYVNEITKHGHQCLIYDLPDHDILDEHDLVMQLQKVDMCVHFAAMADVTVCIKEQDKNFDVNVKGTYLIGKYCAQLKKKLIFISTCCVYGNSLDQIEKEWKTAPMAEEPYAVSKVAGEYILRGIPNLKYVFLRIGTVYGEGMREALFTCIALRNIHEEKTIYIDGDGNQTRQLIYIHDLILGIVKATLLFDIVQGEIFNLCGEGKQSAIDTIDIAEKIVGKKAIRQHREQRYGQTFKENISIDNAKKKLGWSPRISFYEGMKLAWENDPRWRKTF